MDWLMSDLSVRDRYKIIGSCVIPRPIAWVSSLSADKVPNLAPFSFFNAMGNDPPVLAIGMVRSAGGTLKDTAANIRATAEFVVNLVGEPNAAAMNQTSGDYPGHVDEAALVNVAMTPSQRIEPMRVADAPAAFECRALHILETGPAQIMVLGEIIVAHVADCFVRDASRLKFDIEAMQLIARLHGAGFYSRQTNVFEMIRPT